MKICYLGNANSIHVQRWTNYFANQGHDVHLITLKPYQGDGFHKDITLYPLTVKREIGGLKISKKLTS